MHISTQQPHLVQASNDDPKSLLLSYRYHLDLYTKMTYKGEWEAGFQYGHGDIVTYQGEHCSVRLSLTLAKQLNVDRQELQDHPASSVSSTSVPAVPTMLHPNVENPQSDWAPNIVPALWERTHEGGQPQQQQQCQPPQQQYQPPQQPQQPSGGYGYGQVPVQQPTSNSKLNLLTSELVSGSSACFYPLTISVPVTAGPTQPGGYTTESGQKIDAEDEKKKWYDLDDDKKGLLVGPIS